MPSEHIHFVTGRLAEDSLRAMLTRLAPAAGFEYSVSVLNITVAALLTTEWIAGRLRVPEAADRVLLPGYCRGETAVLSERFQRPVEHGPKDLRELPHYFQQSDVQPADGYGAYDIEIIAEINHCPRLSLGEILSEAKQLQAAGADVIDVGCDPGAAWPGVGQCVSALRDAGHRVSIDSFDAKEVAAAVTAGAELVLSVNSTNGEAAADWGCEVVAVPDEPDDFNSLTGTLEFLQKNNVKTRVDPVLEPIGFGFAKSLRRYMDARRLWPDAEIMMGIGNLTELTDADSAGINVMLLGICQELGIRSVLTTQVINWAKTAVAECDAARKLVHHAVTRKELPKHRAPELVMLRDPRLTRPTGEELAQLASQIKDANYRIFVADNAIHVIAAGLHVSGVAPFDLMQQLLDARPKRLDAAHAFYLGWELHKAATALSLGKNYEQDEPLRWGLAGGAGQSHRLTEPKSKNSDKRLSDQLLAEGGDEQ